MSFSENAWSAFQRSVEDYHITDSPEAEERNPFADGTLEQLLYSKNWVDTVQWHLEDLIRDEDINPADALVLKRRIDASNQKRTDLVEFIDDYFFNKFKEVPPKPNAKLNTETPAWAIDRLSILSLKVYHMALESERKTADEQQRKQNRAKLQKLLEQKKDLCTAIDTLLSDMENGDVTAKTYRQMKMYNDEELNPVLYRKKS